MELEINSVACIGTHSRSLNPLQALIEQEEVTLQELIALQDLESNLDDVSPEFYKKLLNHQQLLKDVMDCALRPESLPIEEIPVSWPFKALEFLSRQQEEFNKSFFSSKSQQTHSDSGTKTEGSQLLDHLFKILENPKPINQTSAGYLLKLFSKLYYDNQQEFFWYFVNNPEILTSCTQHLYNASIADLIWRVIDTYNDDTDNKVQMIGKMLEVGLGSESRQTETLENVQSVIENLIERTEEMNTKKQSIVLCREIICVQNIRLIDKAASQEGITREHVKSLTLVLNSFLKFFIQQKNPKKDAQIMASSVEIVIVSEELLDEIMMVVRRLFHLWFRRDGEEGKGESKYVAISVLHSLLKVSNRVAEALVFQSFVNLCIRLFKDEPNNNILHNEIKGILELSFQTDASTWLITPQLLGFIIESFNQTKQPSYLNQLFYISKLISSSEFPPELKKKEIFTQWTQFLEGNFKARATKYQTVLAKESSTKKDFFSWQSEVQSEEGEESSEVIVVKKYNEGDEGCPKPQKLRFSTASIDQFEEVDSKIVMEINDEEPLFLSGDADVGAEVVADVVDAKAESPETKETQEPTPSKSE